MKVIGLANGATRYICEVQHEEVEKFLNLYYGKMGHLRVGDTVDLGKGYDFASRIDSSMTKVQELIRGSQDVVNSIMNGLNLVAIQKQVEAQRQVEQSVITSDSAK